MSLLSALASQTSCAPSARPGATPPSLGVLTSWALLALSLGLSACSFKSPHSTLVTIQVPDYATRSSYARPSSSVLTSVNSSRLQTPSRAQAQPLAAAIPTSLGNFNCFAVNVSGSGMGSNVNSVSACPGGGPGLIAGMIPSGASITLSVSQGASRSFQLIGYDAGVGGSCISDIASALNAGGGTSPHNLPGMSQAYLLAEQTSDVFSDVTLDLTAAFDSTNPRLAFPGCNGAGAAAQALNFVSSSAIFSVGNGIHTWTPQFNMPGLTITSCTVSPALPLGLSLNTSTCAIAGTPAQTAAYANYTVIAALSDGSTQSTSVSIAVNGTLSGQNAIAAGYNHTCAIVNGSAQCWGLNTNGALGNSSTFYSQVPVQVQGLTSGVSTIVAGYLHTCAIVNGSAQCWGYNLHGQLGNNSTTDSPIPVQVQGLTSGVSAIAGGWYQTCAIVNGSAQCWGLNNNGQLGNNSTTESHIPVQVQGLTSGVSAIAAGVYHTCAIVNGSAQCWGYNAMGQLGNGSTTQSTVPVQVQGLSSGVSAIAAGLQHTCAIVNGGAQCWGLNSSGQLGNNSTADSLIPVQVPGLTSGVTAIVAGEYHTCAIVNGGVQCWGYNSNGQLGNNSTTDSPIPVQVPGLTAGVSAIAAGGYHTCAIFYGSAQCWGLNSSGELGNNSATDSLVPTNALIVN